MSSIADSSGGRGRGLSVQNRTDLPDTLLSTEQSFKYYNRQEPAEAGDALRRTGDDYADSMIWLR